MRSVYLLTLNLLLGLPLIGRATPGPNLLTNGSFEDGVAGWTAVVDDPQKAGALADVDPRGALEGAKSAKLSLPGLGSISLSGTMVPVEGGKDYLFSLWLRSQGFNKPDAPIGVVSNLYLNWYAADRKTVLGHTQLWLQPTAMPDWTLRERMATTPAGTAFADVSLDYVYRTGGQPSTLWLDRIQLRRWDAPSGAGGKSWAFEAARGYFTRNAYRRVADDETGSGYSVLANPRFATLNTYLVGGIYCRELPPGAYRVSYRIRIADKPAESKLLLTWDNNTPNGSLNNGPIYTGDFAQANQYQLFTYHFFVPPGVEWVDFRATWQGDIPTWIDTVTVTEEEKYSDAQIVRLFK